MRLLMGKLELTKGIVKVNGVQTTLSRSVKLVTTIKAVADMPKG
jgi:hypothetical protein